jgi:transcriptional regulator with XRE-family HTH domain
MSDTPGRQQLSGHIARDYDQAAAVLRQRWLTHGPTHYVLARRLGCTRNVIGDWLTGRSGHGARRFFALANALGYDVALIPREGAPPIVHTCKAELMTERFWCEHVDPVADQHGIDRPKHLHRDPGDAQQHLFKHTDGRVLLVIRTDREDA